MVLEKFHNATVVGLTGENQAHLLVRLDGDPVTSAPIVAYCFNPEMRNRALITARVVFSPLTRTVHQVLPHASGEMIPSTPRAA